MKVLEILLIVLLIILIYPGIDYLKKASEKSFRKGVGEKPSDFTGSDYFKPEPIWQDNENTSYIFGGVSVLGTGICRIYTYENPLVSQKTDKYGNSNLLSNVSYVKPNIENAFQDFVNGNSHLSGRLSDIKNDQEGKCIDIDQVNVKYASKKCGASNKANYENRCIDSSGRAVGPGVDFPYTVDCGRNLCPGNVGCISLNYITDGDTISVQTKCISIKGISVPTNLDSVYDLDFYRQLGIINEDPKLNGKDYYPVQLGLCMCDNTDARQKFKIIRYSSKGTSSNIEGRLALDPVGSYAALVFRGLNSYLDMDGGNFKLVPMPESEVESAKWIFFPETKLTDNTIPSSQRCVGITSNIYADPSLVPASGTAVGGTGVLGVKRIVKVGRYIANNVGKSTTFRGAPNVSKGPRNYNPEFNPDEDDGPVEGEPTADMVGDAATDAGDAAAAAAGEGGLAGLDVLLGPLAAILLILAILSLIFGALPDPTYDKNNPFSSYGISKGSRVIPSNFLGDITDTGKGLDGEANVIALDKFCTRRDLPSYPPYFLEAVTDNQAIETKLINYGTCVGVHFSGRQFFTGGAQIAYGIFLWKNQNNYPAKPINKLWQDGDTVWEVKPTFSEAIVYPKSYFVEDSLNSVNDFEPQKITSFSGLYTTKSASGYITKLNFDNSSKSFNLSGRLPGIYTGVTSNIGSATFNVSVINTYRTPTETKTKIGVLVVNEQSPGYKKDEKLIIKGTEIGGSSPDQDITFGVSETANQSFVFKALYKYSDGNYYFPEATPPSNQSLVEGGFEIRAVFDSKEGIVFYKDTTLDGGTLPSGVISAGTGYTKGSVLYMAQYTTEGVLTMNFDKFAYPASKPISPTKCYPEYGSQLCPSLDLFIKLTVDTVSSSTYDFKSLAPQKLIDNNTSSSDFILKYNFMDNATNSYDACPQQLVYGGEKDDSGQDLISVLSGLVKGNLKPKNIKALFLDSRDPETGLLTTGVSFSPLNLKSLQVDTLKYQVVPVDEKFEIKTENIDNSNVILGRFIPYKNFEPAMSDPNDPANLVGDHDKSKAISETEYMLEYGVSYHYYNQNYTQIIPYGIPDVYSNSSFVKNSPKF